ncbi:unnamed protein product [Lota lota]
MTSSARDHDDVITLLPGSTGFSEISLALTFTVSAANWTSRFPRWRPSTVVTQTSRAGSLPKGPKGPRAGSIPGPYPDHKGRGDWLYPETTADCVSAQAITFGIKRCRSSRDAVRIGGPPGARGGGGHARQSATEAIDGV